MNRAFRRALPWIFLAALHALPQSAGTPPAIAFEKEATWKNPKYQNHLIKGIQWAMGETAR